MKLGLLTLWMALLLMGSDCGHTVNDCPEGTAIPNVNFDNGSRECLPFDEICFTEDRASTIACADCPTCDPYEPTDGGVPDASVDGEVPECVTDAECDQIDAARCDTETGTCVGCAEDLNCVGVDGLERCDADEGLCVECKPMSEALDCGTTSCNPATFECTDTVRESRIVCESCVSDSDCEPDLGCVPMTFGETPRATGYCLYPADLGPCEQPFAYTTPDARESLSGAAAVRYCGVNEQLTTCEAAWDLVNNKPCVGDEDCSALGGLCRDVGSLGERCSYECSFAAQCLPPGEEGSTCGDADGTAEEKYCGG